MKSIVQALFDKGYDGADIHYFIQAYCPMAGNIFISEKAAQWVLDKQRMEIDEALIRIRYIVPKFN